MACARGVCTADKIFIFINIAFAMYSGALLATAARLAWDPSTYTWFRFFCAAQYRVSAAYVLAAGLWLAALVYLAVAAAAQNQEPSPKPRCLHLYAAGVACLGVSEVGYGAWMGASLAAWWREAPEAELARKGVDLMHDLKPMLLAVERYRDVARPVLDMLDEVEHKAPNNVFVIIVFGLVGLVLQIAAFVMACRLARREPIEGKEDNKEARACVDEGGEEPGWRTKDESAPGPPPPPPLPSAPCASLSPPRSRKRSKKRRGRPTEHAPKYTLRDVKDGAWDEKRREAKWEPGGTVSDRAWDGGQRAARDAAWDAVQAQFKATRRLRPPPSAPSAPTAAALLILHTEL